MTIVILVVLLAIGLFVAKYPRHDKLVTILCQHQSSQVDRVPALSIFQAWLLPEDTWKDLCRLQEDQRAWYAQGGRNHLQLREAPPMLHLHRGIDDM